MSNGIREACDVLREVAEPRWRATTIAVALAACCRVAETDPARADAMLEQLADAEREGAARGFAGWSYDGEGRAVPPALTAEQWVEVSGLYDRAGLPMPADLRRA